ncbi:MAG: lysophospholipid acyltransferase family protein [Bacteroidaceae bacterium]
MIQEIKYKLVYGTFYVLSLLPFSLLYAFTAVFRMVLYHVVRYRRPIVRKNLTLSFPDKSPAEILKIEHEFYRFFCNCFVETIKLMSVSKENIQRRMTFKGIDLLHKELETHDFCFLLLGHYGNWEWLATLPLWLQEGVTCSQVYHPLRSATFDRLFLHIRGRFGGDNIAKNHTMRRVLSMRAKGEKAVVGFVSDQTPKQINIHDWVNFMHQDTGIFTGAERIGKKVNAAMFYGEMKRIKRGHYCCTYHPITAEIGSLEKFKVTEIYMQLLEKTICADPVCWLWTHNRWKRKRQS